MHELESNSKEGRTHARIVYALLIEQAIWNSERTTHTGSTYCMYALLIKLDKSISKIGYFVLLLLLPKYSLNIHMFSIFIYWFQWFFISILNTGKYIFIWFLNFCHVLFWSYTGYKIMVQINDGPQRNKDMVQIKMDKHISTLMCV